MSRDERTAWRDRAYSAWHRSLPYDLDFLDLDWVEYCHKCKRRLAVYELCADIEQINKVAYITKGVADALRVPGFIVLYEAKDDLVQRFRVRRITDPVTTWKLLSPSDWASQLVALRTCHPLSSSVSMEVTPPPVPLHTHDFQEEPDGRYRCASCHAVYGAA